jgi:hypothetical protein
MGDGFNEGAQEWRSDLGCVDESHVIDVVKTGVLGARLRRGFPVSYATTNAQSCDFKDIYV